MEPDELLALVDGYETPQLPIMPGGTQLSALDSSATPQHQRDAPAAAPAPTAALQPDPANHASPHDEALQGNGSSGHGGSLGCVADPPSEASRLDAWIDHVEARHQADAAAAALAPDPPDLEALMQEWPPAMLAHIASSPLPDPRQDVDLPTYARMCCSMLDLAPPPGAAGTAGLAHCLHALFALYLEFRHNPAFRHRPVFGGGGDGKTQPPGWADAAAAGLGR